MSLNNENGKILEICNRLLHLLQLLRVEDVDKTFHASLENFDH